MSSDVDKILKDALALPTNERARLIAELMASVDEGPDVRDAEWLAEIRRRADKVLAGESRGEPWPAVRERLESALKKK